MDSFTNLQSNETNILPNGTQLNPTIMSIFFLTLTIVSMFGIVFNLYTVYILSFSRDTKTKLLKLLNHGSIIGIALNINDLMLSLYFLYSKTRVIKIVDDNKFFFSSQNLIYIYSYLYLITRCISQTYGTLIDILVVYERIL